MELTIPKSSLSLSLSLSLSYNACELTSMLILRCQSGVLYVMYSIIVKENDKTKMMLIITKKDNLGGVCYCCLNNNFQYLNNITRIFTHFSPVRIFTKQQQHY